MEFKKINISDLKPADYNPRKDLKPGDKEFEKIKNSIKVLFLDRNSLGAYSTTSTVLRGERSREAPDLLDK